MLVDFRGRLALLPAGSGGCLEDMGRQHFSDFFPTFKLPASATSRHRVVIILVQVGVGHVDVIVVIVDIVVVVIVVVLKIKNW